MSSFWSFVLKLYFHHFESFEPFVYLKKKLQLISTFSESPHHVPSNLSVHILLYLVRGLSNSFWRLPSPCSISTFPLQAQGPLGSWGLPQVGPALRDSRFLALPWSLWQALMNPAVGHCADQGNLSGLSSLPSQLPGTRVTCILWKRPSSL